MTRSPSPSLFPPDHTPDTASAGWVNAHCDGGARGNPGPAGFGAVLTDESGRTLAELSEFLGICSNNVAEYRGLLATLDWALAHHAPRLRVVSDSLLMVNQIKGKFKVNSPDLRPLWEEARRKINQLERFEISHALRHKNKDADRLANEAMDRGTGRGPAPDRGTARGPAPDRGTARGPAPDRGTANPAPARPAPGSPPPPDLTGGRLEAAQARSRIQAAAAAPASGTMLRGFVRDGAIHILGDARLPDGIFVKVIPE